MKRRYRKNPLSQNAKWGLVVGGAAALFGTIAFVATRPAAATASPISLPASFVHGHRYKMAVSASSAGIDPVKLAALKIADAQAMFDGISPGIVKVISVGGTINGGRANGEVVFDIVGPTQQASNGWSIPDSVRDKIAAEHGSIVVTDTGVSPAGIAGLPRSAGVGGLVALFTR